MKNNSASRYLFVMKLFLSLSLILIPLNSEAQVQHIGSFSDLNSSASLELFGAKYFYITGSGEYLYANSDNMLLRYTLNRETGHAISVNTYEDRMKDLNSSGMCGAHIAHTNNEEYLYLASGCQSAIAVFHIDQESGACSFVDTLVNGSDGIEGVSKPVSVTVSRNDEFLYLASGDKLLTTFSIDMSTGLLQYIGSVDHSEIMEYVHYISVTPDNLYLYVISTSGDQLSIFSRDVSTGSLTFLKSLNTDVESGFLMDGISDIEFDSNGYVYITSKYDNVLQVFKTEGDYSNLVHYKTFRDGEDGVTGLEMPIAVQQSPDPSFIYVISHDPFTKTAITVFKWREDNTLHFAGSNVYTSLSDPGMLYYPANMKISPDSRFLYVAEERNTICEYYQLGAFLDLGEDKDICSNEPVFLNADASYSEYEWSDGTSGESIEVSSSGTVYLDVVDAFGKTGSDTVLIEMNPAPEIFLGADTIIHYNDTLVLEIDEVFTSYMWNNGETDESVVFIADSMNADTLISVYVENEYGCVSHDTIAVYVFPLSNRPVEKEGDVVVYPNPSNGFVKVSGIALEAVQIVDSSGQVIFSDRPEYWINSYELDLTGMKPGIYYLCLSGEGRSDVRKIVIQ